MGWQWPAGLLICRARLAWRKVLAASVPACALLWSVERRRGQPLVDPRLLARPAVGVIYVDL